MFFSKQTGGFYATEIHGDAIPADAVEITTEEHAELLAGQSCGKRIVADKDGRPVLAEPPQPSASELIKIQIAELEATITDRRIREAVLGIDNGWLKDINDQIVTLRATLK